MNLSEKCNCCVCEPVCKYKEVYQNGIEAIKRFGWDNIQHEVVCEVSSREEAYIKEKEYIEKYKSFDERYGYNRNKGSRVSVSGGVSVEEALKGIDELLTVTEVSKMFSVSRQTVLKWINNGKIKAVKVYRIPKEEIDRLIDNQRKEDENGKATV